MGVLLFKGGVGVGMLKWQTSDLPELRAKFVEFFGYDPSNRASESLIKVEGKTVPSNETGGDDDEGDARIGERLCDDTEHAGG